MTTLAPFSTPDHVALPTVTPLATAAAVQSPALPPVPVGPPLTHRDRAVLRAVAAGRCVFSADGASLTIDSVACCDQFVGARLAGAGLITGIGRAELTPAGRAILTAV